MALTSAQIVAVRYYMGYAVAGNATYFAYRELAYSDVSYMSIGLDNTDGAGGRLQNLSSDEEDKITTFFLPNLAAAETDIQTARTNLDTAQAAVWTRNPKEMAERKAAFRDLRESLCVFLGFPLGPALSRGSMLVRT